MDYTIVRTPENPDELMHYGVRGMKWGIRKATRELGSSNAETRQKGAARLESHRAKAVKKVAKLESKQPRLQKQVDRAILKTDVKAAKFEKKAGRETRKAMRAWTSEGQQKHLTKAQVYDMKVKELKSRSSTAKAQLAKNERMIEMFNKGIKDIDEKMINVGREYMNS